MSSYSSAARAVEAGPFDVAVVGYRAATIVALVIVLLLTAGAPGAVAAQEVVREVVKGPGQDHRVRVEKRVIVLDGDGNVVTEDVSGHGHVGASASERDTFVWVSESGDGTVFETDIRMGISGGFLGVETVELTEALREHFGVPAGEGVMVSNVVEDSGAMTGGVDAADIITAVAGSTLSSSSDLGKLIREHEPGETVDLEVWRNGKMLVLPVQLGERKRSMVHLDRQGPSSFRFKILDAEDGVNSFEFHSEDAAEDVLKYFEGPEWLERVQRLETMDLDAVEKRMRELEAKIRSLEKQLEDNR